MEDILIIWYRDLVHKKVPISTMAIREQALNFYQHVSINSASSSAVESFSASKGWFENFKKRFSLHNMEFSEVKASADEEAAKNFPAELRDLIAAREYVADQIFNCDETGLYWKKMPARTFLTQEEKSAPGFKAAKDR